MWGDNWTWGDDWMWGDEWMWGDDRTWGDNRTWGDDQMWSDLSIPNVNVNPLIHRFLIVSKNVDFQVQKVAEIVVKYGEGGSPFFEIARTMSEVFFTFFLVASLWIWQLIQKISVSSLTKSMFSFYRVLG